MKKVTAVYFSPTQGSKKYAEAIAAAVEPDFEVIDLTGPKARAGEYRFGPDDLVIFGAPVYAGRLPLVEGGVFDRVTGNGALAVYTVTYGNREFDDALLEMYDLLEERGFRGIAAAAWLAQHTYSDKLAGGRPDADDLQAAADFGADIKALLNADEFGKLEIPGNRPYKEAKHLPMHTEAGEDCSGCGHCAEICPVSAIDAENGFKADPAKCIGCLACEKTCPAQARVVNDPGLAAIRAKLEPAFGGVYKEPVQFFVK